MPFNQFKNIPQVQEQYAIKLSRVKSKPKRFVF